MTFILTLALFTVLVLSMSSYWTLWAGFELYSFVFTPWLLSQESKTTKESIFLYFLTQFLGSSIFLISSLTCYDKVCLVAMFLSILVKLSCFPFHSWFVATVSSVSWEKISVIVSLSKMIPVAAMAVLTPPRGLIWLLSLGMLMPVGAYKTTCLRKMVTYSSVAHSSWLAICLCVSKSATVYYILLYSLIMFPLCILLKLLTITSIKHVSAKEGDLVYVASFLLHLSGVPPMLGFIPKLFVLSSLVESGACYEAFVLGVASFVPLYLYFKTGILAIGASNYPEFMYHKTSTGKLLLTTVGFSLFVLICLL